MEELHLKLIWTGLFGLRFLLTIMPQYGFISEEEFTRSPQLAAEVFGLAKSNKILDLEEFGMFYPAFSSGIPFFILAAMHESRVFGNIITPYSVLIAPRIWMTFCSMLIDVYIYRITVNCGCNVRTALSAMILFAGSYVPLVYFTRTLPVSFIAILYAALIYHTTRNIPLSKNGQEKSLQATCFEACLIAVVTGLGASLDACFVRYAMLPVCFWLAFSTTSYFTKFIKMLVFCYFFLTTLFYVFLQITTFRDPYDNSKFFNPFAAVEPLERTLRSSVVFNYFTKFMENEAESLCSIPGKILFVTNYLCNIFGPVLLVLFRVISGRESFFKLVSNIHDAILVTSVLQPVFEAIILKQLPENAMYVMIIPITVLVAKHAKISKKFFTIYMLFNFGNLLFYGVYKHGGAVHSMEFLGSIMKTVKHVKEIEIVFYETPVLPHYLTARYCTMDQAGACVGQNGARLHFTETTPDTLQPKLDEILLQDRNTLVFLIIHSSLPCKFLHKLHILYDLHIFYNYFPHINPAADTPDFFDSKEWCNSKGEEVWTLTEFIQEKYALNIYGVTRPSTRLKQPEIHKNHMLTLVLNSYSSSI